VAPDHTHVFPRGDISIIAWLPDIALLVVHGFSEHPGHIANSSVYDGMMQGLMVKWHICKNKPAPSIV